MRKPTSSGIKAGLLLALIFASASGRAQYVYTINADSVKITNHCDTAELIIENHTQNVPGFLYNKGRGRTEFRRALQRLSTYSYLIGGDTLYTQTNAWLQGGNSFNATGVLGTLDNNDLDVYTNNAQRARFATTGNFIVGSTQDNLSDRLQVWSPAGNLVSTCATLSRPNDRIRLGGYINTADGQNTLLSTSSDGGATYKNILVERDGNIGLGYTSSGWVVGRPNIRIASDGNISMFSPIYFGNTGGPWNCSALITTVSNANEWEQGESSVHNDQNYYYFGTILQTPSGTNKRAPLRISGRELQWLTGNTEAETARLNESGRMLIGSSTDNGHKLQVNGSTFSNYFTNVSTALGTGEDGALRLRWGGPGGFYIDFYNQNNSGKRGFIASASDSRPLQIHDSIGVSLVTTPYLALGTEPSIGGARFSVCNPENSGVSTVNFTHVVNGLMNYDFVIVPSGNVVVGGGGADNGNRFQVNGSAYIGGNTGVGTAFPTAQLHTTGSVRFAGLTADSSLSRVLVSDAFGNISYRNLSSWASVSTFRNGLTVNGTLSAQKIRLQPGSWADYVFDKGYHLTPLRETEAYINRYHHLPGLPSATEVESNGVDLAETQTALLAKIEELTLHLIREEKDKQALREEVEQLKKQNEELRALRNEVEELKRMIRK